jgi:hypothetical protein
MRSRKNYKFLDETIEKLDELEKITQLKQVRIVEIAIDKFYDLIIETGYDLTKLKLK